MKSLIAAFMLLGAAAAQVVAQPSTAPSDPASYWVDRWRGWHFYEDPAPEPAAPREPKVTPRKPAELTELELLRKRLDDYRGIALMRPTEANVRRYMELEARVVGQASRFADIAQRVAWTTPELDPTLQGRPVNAKALEVFEQDQLQDRARTITELAKDHVLFFFFRSDCPYCHAFAPTLAAFQARYGIPVVGVSMDGGALPAFPAPRRDNGIARTLQVNQVPAVFLARPVTGDIAPVGFGVLSEAQLLERISAVSSAASAPRPSDMSAPIPLH